MTSGKRATLGLHTGDEAQAPTLSTMILMRSSSICLRHSSAHDRTACAFLGLRGSYLAGSYSPVACGYVQGEKT